MKSIHEDYGFMLHKITEKMGNKFIKALEPYKIKPNHFGILLLVNEYENIDQTKAGEILRTDRTSMVYIIDYLEELNYLKRVKNPKDRRYYGLHLTEKGKEVLDPCWNILKEIEKEVLGGSKEKEVLKRIYENLDK
ncbi:MAG: MarR family transcriptional regulator [Methanobrevibacter sp.]|jgi:DNA-binding MarR family transcriptional regulator|nr:MarR family transcriptional regulator [Candidatus Methanoflexus mossambicus]